MGLFWIISLEIGGNIPWIVLGDYRGNSFRGRPTRGEVYVFTSVIPHNPQYHKSDFFVLLAQSSQMFG